MTIYARGLTKSWKKVAKHNWNNSKPCDRSKANQHGLNDYIAIYLDRAEYYIRRAYRIKKGNKAILRGPGSYRSI